MDIQETVLNMMHTSITNHVALAFGEKQHAGCRPAYREMLQGPGGHLLRQGRR